MRRAHTAVDKAESEPDLARPSMPPRRACWPKSGALGAWLVHYSTDYVFDGSGDRRATKRAHRAAERLRPHQARRRAAIRASGCHHLILRTSWVYAARGGNFARTMLRLAAERDELKVIADQIGAPTGADLLADVTAHAARACRPIRPEAGTYHCVASGETSWHGYASLVIEWARAHGQAIRVAPGAIQPIPTSAYPTPARRPLNSRLDTPSCSRPLACNCRLAAGVERMLTEVLDR
jgi:dTDP-4-dehydrorhamnose reductase